MADTSSLTNPEEAFEYYTTRGVPELLRTLVQVSSALIAGGEKELEAEVSALITEIITDLNRLARQYAAISERVIIERIHATQSHNRPMQGEMETHIKSAPGPLGSVEVALVSELDRIVNSRGQYGPFWRAQEFGTGQATDDPRFDPVPSQEGRPLFGTFYGSETPPDPAQQGLGVGHDVMFIPFGSAPGLGRIQVDLPGRHFLRDGSRIAGERYLLAMGDIETRYVTQMRALMLKLRERRGASAAGGFIGRIEA